MTQDNLDKDVDDLITPKSWEEFRATKMLWFVNRLLHVFGWAIVVEVEDDGSVSKVYPARVGFRGFTEQLEDEGFKGISEYMVKESKTLLNECSGDTDE